MVNSILQIPTSEEKQKLVDAFVEDLASFTVNDKATGLIRPVICCVCDSIPHHEQWGVFVEMKQAIKLFEKNNLQKSNLHDIYCEPLLAQYTASNSKLKEFVLSPATFVNEKQEVLMCKECYSDMYENIEKHTRKDRVIMPPKQAIANGYLIGDAPFDLECLNDVELSLVSKVRIYCQSWIFYGGCHQHIKGWHTFFKNRTTENVANLMQLTENNDSESAIILVVLCGPFTSTQRALTLDKTAVCPYKVIAAWEWLRENNFRYKDMTIPNIDDIPIPHVICEEMYVLH
jgi:hypothetical protein